MLRTTSPNISVITNFGCRADCWYCIWKGHALQYVNEPTDWYKLEKFLKDNAYKGKVSVSGGGDCLYRFDEHEDWWCNFFDITNSLKMLVDVHSREYFYNPCFWRTYINRCVFSSDYPSVDAGYLSFITSFTKIRITHLVTADTTFEIIEDYLELQNKLSCQFTIKELIGFDDNGMYQKIRKEFPEIYHLDAGDYNIYYMPDNSIRTSFL